MRDDAKAAPTRAKVEALERRVNELRVEKVSGLNGGIEAVRLATGADITPAILWARGARRAVEEEMAKGPEIDWTA